MKYNVFVISSSLVELMNFKQIPMQISEYNKNKILMNGGDNDNNNIKIKNIKKSLDLPPVNVNANMEFMAYRIDNLFGSFFSSQLISASFSRTALNYEMSGHTRIAGFIRVVLCVLCLLLLMAFLSSLPKCVLASVVCTAVYRVIKSGVVEFKFLYSVSKLELIEFQVNILTSLDPSNPNTLQIHVNMIYDLLLLEQSDIIVVLHTAIIH